MKLSTLCPLLIAPILMWLTFMDIKNDRQIIYRVQKRCCWPSVIKKRISTSSFPFPSFMIVFSFVLLFCFVICFMFWQLDSSRLDALPGGRCAPCNDDLTPYFDNKALVIVFASFFLINLAGNWLGDEVSHVFANYYLLYTNIVV